MSKSYIIAVDFDGTIADHRYPEIGEAVPGAIDSLKTFAACGARLILFTMRSDLRSDGRNYLTEAVEWCRARGVEFWGVNQNPEQASWTSSPKPYAHIYIDDAAAGCPLRENPRYNGRPMVDWKRVEPMVLERIGAVEAAR